MQTFETSMLEIIRKKDSVLTHIGSNVIEMK